jgi:hypothetical protein
MVCTADHKAVAIARPKTKVNSWTGRHRQCESSADNAVRNIMSLARHADAVAG